MWSIFFFCYQRFNNKTLNTSAHTLKRFPLPPLSFELWIYKKNGLKFSKLKYRMQVEKKTYRNSYRCPTERGETQETETEMTRLFRLTPLPIYQTLRFGLGYQTISNNSLSCVKTAPHTNFEDLQSLFRPRTGAITTR